MPIRPRNIRIVRDPRRGALHWKTGAIAAFGVGGQCELTNDQGGTADVHDGFVHLARVILEYAQLGDFADQLIGLGLCRLPWRRSGSVDPHLSPRFVDLNLNLCLCHTLQ